MKPDHNRSATKEISALLEANLRILQLAKADDWIIDEFKLLIEHVKGSSGRDIFYQKRTDERPLPDLMSETKVRELSIEEVTSIINDERVPRRLLEQIAIQRFGVPKGSMRKWGSKESLRDKISTMLRNERTHRTIGEVARQDR